MEDIKIYNFQLHEITQFLSISLAQYWNASLVDRAQGSMEAQSISL